MVSLYPTHMLIHLKTDMWNMDSYAGLRSSFTHNKATSHKAWNTHAEYARWECKYDTREFHNEFNPVF